MEGAAPLVESDWGSGLPEPFMRDLLALLQPHFGRRWHEAGRFRGVCAGWQAAHDAWCSSLYVRNLQKTPATLPRLERVTTVVISYLAGGQHTPHGVMAAHLPKLQSLPSLTSLNMTIHETMSVYAEANALGTLTTLKKLTLKRNLELELVHNGYNERRPDEEMDWAFEVEEHSEHLRDRAKKEAGWLASLCSLQQLTSLDLSECHNVRIDGLAGLSGLTSLKKLALRGKSDAIYQCGDESSENVTTLVGKQLGKESVQPVLCRLTKLVLANMAVSDAALLKLAVLPNLKYLSLLGCDEELSFCHGERKWLGVAAARKAAPQLKLTTSVEFNARFAAL